MRAGRRLSSRLAASVLALGAAGGGLAVVAVPTPAYAVEKGIPCESFATPDVTEASDPVALPSDPFAEMGIAEARAAVRRPGAGIDVAVIDSGIEGATDRPAFAGSKPPVKDYHGTTVAGLIRAIAPAVHLIDLPVYVPPAEGSDKPGTVPGESVRGALDALLKRRDVDHLIVNMSLDVGPSRALESRVEELLRRGAVVVAATGNVTTSGPHASPAPGADWADRIAPATYPGVVAVGASLSEDAQGDDISQFVLPNSRTTVVAPTYGARSVTLGGRACFVDQTATSWSTAEVSGVLALVASAFPRETNTELVDRLERTAAGRPDEPGRFTGAGVVQAYAAVTRPLAADRSSRAEVVKRAEVAPPKADVLEGTRHDAVWWGLIGGGVLLLGLVLRPLLSRRR